MKIIQRLLLLLCAAGLAVSAAGMTLAYRAGDTPAVLYDGAARTLTILNAPNGDLFVGMKDLMPGDTRVQQIALQAQNLQGSAALYLRASCDDVTAQALEPLTLTVYADGKMLDSGPAGGSDTLKNGVLLYRFDGDGTTALRVELQVPETVGNELAATQHGLQWIFTLQEADAAAAQDAAAPGGADTVRLVPQTGDRTPLALWQAMFCLSAAVLVLLLAAGRRARKKTSDGR